MSGKFKVELELTEVDTVPAPEVGQLSVFAKTADELYLKLSDGSEIKVADERDVGGGHTIQKDGVSLPDRANLNFQGPNLVVTDDGSADSTDVSLTGLVSDSITINGQPLTGDVSLTTDDVPEGTTNRYNVQANWLEGDEAAPDYIQNKPEVFQNPMTQEYSLIVGGYEGNAEELKFPNNPTSGSKYLLEAEVTKITSGLTSQPSSRSLATGYEFGQSAIITNSGKIFYVVNRGSELALSTDKGLTFNFISGQNSSILGYDKINDVIIKVGTTTARDAYSEDDGETWKPVPRPIDGSYITYSIGLVTNKIIGCFNGCFYCTKYTAPFNFYYRLGVSSDPWKTIPASNFTVGTPWQTVTTAYNGRPVAARISTTGVAMVDLEDFTVTNLPYGFTLTEPIAVSLVNDLRENIYVSSNGVLYVLTNGVLTPLTAFSGLSPCQGISDLGDGKIVYMGSADVAQFRVIDTVAGTTSFVPIPGITGYAARSAQVGDLILFQDGATTPMVANTVSETNISMGWNEVASQESGHVILDSSGTALPQRGSLQFSGNVAVIDDEASDATSVTVTGLTDITAGTNVTIDKTDPSNPIISSTNTEYVLPPATGDSLGGVIVGDGLTISSSGVLSAAGVTGFYRQDFTAADWGSGLQVVITSAQHGRGASSLILPQVRSSDGTVQGVDMNVADDGTVTLTAAVAFDGYVVIS